MTATELRAALQKAKDGADIDELVKELTEPGKQMRVYIEIDGDDLQVTHVGFPAVAHVITALHLAAGAITQQVTTNVRSGGIMRPPFVPPRPGQP